MPARIIGMIGVSPPQQELVIEGEISPPFILEFAQAHEAAGFDMVLVGYSSSSAEGFLVAMHAAARTARMSYLIAHRPGFIAPTLFARKVATFDQLTGGRLALHIITGKTDAEQEGDRRQLQRRTRTTSSDRYWRTPRRRPPRRRASFSLSWGHTSRTALCAARCARGWPPPARLTATEVHQDKHSRW